MPPQIVTIANAFYAVAALFGIPAAAVTVLYAVHRLRLAFATPPPAPSAVKNPDALLLVIEGMSRALNTTATFFSGVSNMVFSIVAGIAGVALVASIALFLTGRGLHAHHAWARFAGSGLMAVALVAGLFSLLTFRGPLMLGSLAVILASGYALMGLWRGFPA